MIITVVDSAESVEHILPIIGPMVREGLITVEDVEIVKYTHRHLSWRKAERPSLHPGAHSAADVMLTDVFSVQRDTPLSEVLQEMLERRVKRLAVVDAEGHLAGLVERQTLLEALLSKWYGSKFDESSTPAYNCCVLYQAMSEKLAVDSSLPSSSSGHLSAPQSQICLGWAGSGRHQVVGCRAQKARQSHDLSGPP